MSPALHLKAARPAPITPESAILESWGDSASSPADAERHYRNAQRALDPALPGYLGHYRRLSFKILAALSSQTF